VDAQIKSHLDSIERRLGDAQEGTNAMKTVADRLLAENGRLRAALQWIRDYSPLPLAVLAKANEALISSRPMTPEEVEAAEQIEAEDYAALPKCSECGYVLGDEGECKTPQCGGGEAVSRW
jgi:hypothetical protein